MTVIPLPGTNPFDRTAQHDFEDLPPIGESEEERRVREMGAGAKEEALVHNTLGKDLTGSPGFAMLRELIEGQRQAYINKMLLTPVTEANKDEMNFERGTVHGLMLAMKFASALTEGSKEVLELLKQKELMDANRE